MSSVIIAGDTSGTVTLQAPSAAGSTVINLPAVNGTAVVNSNATNVLAEAQGGTGTTVGYYGFKNRIINGAMMIDQRAAGASTTVATNGYYSCDRWKTYSDPASKYAIQQNAGAVTPPAGFSKYLGITSASSYSVGAGDYFWLEQAIEGNNIQDLAWGTASAATVTLSFWVRSSLTGQFGGSLTNAGRVRAYPFSYTISAANTWEQKTITVAGDTSGTWATGNTAGLLVIFDLGSGSTFLRTAGSWGGDAIGSTGDTKIVATSGATFYITGVQLEKGSTATSFDYRPYGTELALCQRYYYKVIGVSVNSSFGSGYAVSTTNNLITTSFPVTMRANPTSLEQSGTASHYAVGYLTTSAACTSVPTFNSANPNTAASLFPTSGITAGQGVRGINDNAAGYLAWSAEL